MRMTRTSPPNEKAGYHRADRRSARYSMRRAALGKREEVVLPRREIPPDELCAGRLCELLQGFRPVLRGLDHAADSVCRIATLRNRGPKLAGLKIAEQALELCR